MVKKAAAATSPMTLVFLVVIGALLMLFVVAGKPAQGATTFTVNLPSDQQDARDSDGRCDVFLSLPNNQCTLRAAVEQANANEGADTINFNITRGNTAVKTIKPLSVLPALVDRVTINGYSQPGAQANMKTNGNDAVLLIELDGTNAGDNARGLLLQDNNVVRGLVINHFALDGIAITGNGNRVEGNFIGTDPSGILDRGNRFRGVFINRGTNNTIGGATPDKRNLISGNGSAGILFSDSGNSVLGNFIGTQKNGTTALGNDESGVFIGVGPNAVGGESPGEANTIAFNGAADDDADGVAIPSSAGVGNNVLRNSIFANGLGRNGLGIDLLPVNGPTPNDVGDGDSGPNGLQNKPVLISAVTSGGSTTIDGRLSSKPNKTFTIQFFSNPSGNEGKKFIGQRSVTTNDSGNVTFSALILSTNQAVEVGQQVTATATGEEGTSEFSAPRQVTAP